MEQLLAQHGGILLKMPLIGQRVISTIGKKPLKRYFAYTTMMDKKMLIFGHCRLIKD